MLPKLANSQKLLEEIKYFEKKASSMSKEDKEFIHEQIVKIKKISHDIDRAHDIRENGFIPPSLISNSRDELNNARYEIFKKIKLQDT